MGSGEYQYTSGRKLHYQDCLHFVEELPARKATAEELRDLPDCETCVDRAATSGQEGGRFTCPRCHLSKRLSMLTPSGVCRDCAADEA